MSYHTLTGNYLRGQQPIPVTEVSRTAAGVKGHLVKTADLPEVMLVSNFGRLWACFHLYANGNRYP